MKLQSTTKFAKQKKVTRQNTKTVLVWLPLFILCHMEVGKVGEKAYRKAYQLFPLCYWMQTSHPANTNFKEENIYIVDINV
jgi:hypothetical protein